MMIDIDGQHEWRDCLDLPGVRLPQGYYFGASAITGDLSGKQVQSNAMAGFSFIFKTVVVCFRGHVWR